MEILSTAWTTLGIDPFALQDEYYLVLVGYLSKFPIMRRISNETSTVVIQSIKAISSEFGNVKEIVSDNGPCFKSFEFEDFVKSLGIKHTNISPYHHQANGQVEQCIRTIKGVLKQNSNDPWMPLLIWRSTPVDGHMKSPAENLQAKSIS